MPLYLLGTQNQTNETVFAQVAVRFGKARSTSVSGSSVRVALPTGTKIIKISPRNVNVWVKFGDSNVVASLANDDCHDYCFAGEHLELGVPSDATHVAFITDGGSEIMWWKWE